jgi:hypothetical protein
VPRREELVLRGVGEPGPAAVVLVPPWSAMSASLPDYDCAAVISLARSRFGAGTPPAR